jgi:RNA polymerase sigma factor (TIGR02999 family)
MDADKPVEITGLLKAWSCGDQGALERLTELVYQELRRMARRYLRNERAGNSIQATALVNEVYLRLLDVGNVDWRERAQFFALSAELMRRILVDAARARSSLKRGGANVRIEFDETAVLSPQPDRFVLALEEALETLEKSAPRQAKVVELRYFGGLTEEETAVVLRTSLRTVQRDWQFARAWLTRALKSAETDGSESGHGSP